jgi:hypothetical protein
MACDLRRKRSVFYFRMKPHLLTVVLLAALAGCSRSGPVAPTSPSSPASSPSPGAGAAVTALAVRGRTLLTSIGETTPLTATASLSDGTSRDVTTAVQWVSSSESTLSVSPGGVVTVLRFGQSYVYATYQGKSATVSVQATPPGTFIVWGRVREPGSSGLPGVQVREETSGASTQSNADGEFSFGGLVGTRLTFEKDGYERAALEAKPGTFTDAPIQRMIRIAAGGSVEVNLAPHDVSYDLGDGLRCDPCKMIRVVTEPAGRLQVKASWSEPRAALNLWINGRFFEGAGGPLEVLGEAAIDAPGEVLVYVGLKNAADYYAPFTLTTNILK